MINFCKRLVRKIGGSSKKEWVEFRSDYWKQENVTELLYVPVEHYTDATKNNIELELARKIGEQLLRKNLLFFSSMEHFPDHGDIPIRCSVNVLTLKNRTSSHMPSRLVIKKGDDKMNEQNRTRQW